MKLKRHGVLSLLVLLGVVVVYSEQSAQRWGIRAQPVLRSRATVFVELELGIQPSYW